MPQTEYQADHSDMVAYMTEANENGEWSPPSKRSVDKSTASAIRANRDTTVLFRIQTEYGVIEAERVDDTTDVVLGRYDERRDRETVSLTYWGEAALWLRYWLLQAAINDIEVTVEKATAETINCMVSSSPPEWETDLRELLENHRE